MGCDIGYKASEVDLLLEQLRRRAEEIRLDLIFHERLVKEVERLKLEPKK